MIVGDFKPPLSELAHFGVKGMKWGVRRSEMPTHSSYTSQMQTADRRIHGSRAVKRINSRLYEGQTHEQALQKEVVRNERQKLAVVGASVLVGLLAQHGTAHISTIGSAPQLASKAAKINYIKPNRHGVHKITTLK